MILERIQKANDIKKLNWDEIDILAVELRKFLVEKVSKTGGHLASNLGAVELTMALHLAFSLPTDKLIWDVGHQSYTHKILTGRKAEFDNLRSFGGMSGFPKRKESPCDAFDTGHSTTSISAGLGYVEARDLLGENHKVVSIIGDGSLTGGMAYEALNNAAHLKSNYIIVLNDNNMSISENVGGMSQYLNGIRTGEVYNNMKQSVERVLKKVPVVGEPMVNYIRRTKNSIKQLIVPGMWFEDMGITYLGPVDGHNTKALYRTFKEAQKMNHAVLVHVMTEKGKGYVHAENNPSKFHGISAFDVDTGNVIAKSDRKSYTDVFGESIVRLGEKYENLVAITAAMKDGTGLGAFKEKFPERFFDVGIAEGHAVTFAAGLAAAGMKPVFAVYSSFLQRGYDQLVHDVCMQNLPVVFAVDRAGLVGNDGETHQGNFDLAFGSHIPNLTIMAPKNAKELDEMLAFSVTCEGPVIVRYPRGNAYEGYEHICEPIVLGKSEIIQEGKDISIFALGTMVEEAEKVCRLLLEKGYTCNLVNVRFAKPFDQEILRKLAQNSRVFVTMEDGMLIGGYGMQVANFVQQEHLQVKVLTNGISDVFVEHGAVSRLRQEVGLDAESITNRILENL